MKKLLLLLCTATSSYAWNPLSLFPRGETRWDWTAIAHETQNYSFTSFANLKTLPYWGTADSDLQSAGLQSTGTYPVENNWSQWQQRQTKDGSLIVPVEKHIGIANGSWDNYTADIACMKQLGINAHRFSIEWSKIEPHKGVFDRQAMQRYIDFTNALIANGIKPLPTLFHHAWPVWFEYQDDDNRGYAFEDDQNIQDFVEYCTYVFTQLMNGVTDPHKLNIWLTINEPVAYAMAAYIDGAVPPGKKFNIRTCGRVVKNFLDAHIAVYDMMHKNNIHNVALQISFPKLFNPIQPYNPWNPLDQAVTRFFNYILHTPALNYLTTGTFYWPGLGSTVNPTAAGKLDFVGVNYYSHTLVKTIAKKNVAARPFEVVAEATDPKHEPPRTLYAEGFYEVIKQASGINKPIWILENGFPTDDINKRTEYIQKHMYVLSKVIAEGIKIDGYLWWTLLDNYEWNAGNGKYGIFTKDRILKPSMQYLINLLHFIK